MVDPTRPYYYQSRYHPSHVLYLQLYVGSSTTPKIPIPPTADYLLLVQVVLVYTALDPPLPKSLALLEVIHPDQFTSATGSQDQNGGH